jgi:hypothetical protein
MNKSEAQQILSQRLARFTSRSHAQLAPLVESRHVEADEIQGASGATYQIEIQFFWDDQPGGAIRIIGSIDDGGLRAFFPLTDSFLVTRTED